ncbi:hypothetical protein PVAG01_01190 [Phlyctema vagabunda]|uniref:Chorismate synthase protein n=1 Tax=Phlyctema vagabunda TaxID=108571 RepID=A0ABR4PWG4_9HELO
MVSWGTIKSVVLFAGPILLPKAIAYYRSVRAAPTVQGVSIRPVPANVSRALGILFVTAIVFFIKTIPYFAPENIFALTQSRLQIPNDVLFTRLAALRSTGLTATDQILRSKLHSLESRLLYFQYGPDVITGCQFCTAEDSKNYLFYAVPAILAPYLFNLCVLALATSGLFTGKEGAVWRRTATIAGGAIALIEVYLVSSYHHQANARATRLEDIDAFFWKMRVYRGLMIAAVDALLGWVLYLSSTNRAFVVPLSAPERLEATTKAVENIRRRLGALALLKNSVNRDPDLRHLNQDYWVREGVITSEAMAEREVVESVNNALRNRLDIQKLMAESSAHVNEFLIGPANSSLTTAHGRA